MSVIIRMKNLPVSAAASDVRAFFTGLKIPDGAVHIIGGDEGEVFVGFASDEDARIAMTRDRSKIHGEEIRLLLSSKTEQTTVIAARKNATYSSPKAVYDEYTLPIPNPTTPPKPQQNWNLQQASNPYAAQSGYEASYPPQNSKVNDPDFSQQNSFNRRLQIGQHQQLSPEKPKDPFGGDYGGYKHSYPPQRPQQQHPVNNRFQADTSSMKPSEPIKQNIVPPAHVPPVHHPPHQIQKSAPEPQYGIRGAPNNNGVRENDFNEPGSGRIAVGDSWRDNSFKQQNRNDYNDDRRDYQEDFKPDLKNNFQGGNKFNQAPIRNDPPPMNQHQPDVRPTQPQNSRKTLMPTPPAPFQNTPPPFAAHPSGGSNIPANRPFPPGPQQPYIPNRNGPPGFQRGPAALPVQNNMNRPMPPVNHPPAPFQNPMAAPPSAKVPVFNQPPIIPPVNKPIVPAAQPNAEKFYVELTRLPMELLRPAALEAFIRPTAPLTLSSVKTVFGPGGIHMHTIIRLDSIADYATMMRRNGEQGIKIQQSDKKTFDTAIDGAPLPMVIPPVPIVTRVVPPMNVEVSRDDDENRRLKRSRWESNSPENDPKKSSPRRSPPRRDHRDRSRSNSPPRRGTRFRSPTRREQRDHKDPTRWSLQVTNVPFRMKEDELMEWFSEKVRPAKLIRTFYADGNASDRWIAEFSSESLMRRSFSIKTLCSGRFLLLRYIPNDRADELIKIEDHYGEEKKIKNEEARAQQEAEFNHPPSFFNMPAPAMRGPPMAPGPSQNPSGPSNGINGAAPSGMNGPPTSTIYNGQPPVRGGFVPRGNGAFQPAPRGGMGRGGSSGPAFHQNGGNSFNHSDAHPQGSFGNNYNNQQNSQRQEPYGNNYHSPPDSHHQGSYGKNYNNPPDSHPQGSFGNQGPDSFRGGYRGTFRGGRGRGGYQGKYRNEETLPTHNEFMELVNSLGPRGTVLSCTGFPKDVTMEDVMGFFGAYDPDRNSIRIRRGDDGVMTGECMLACFGPEKARRASVDLNGHSVRNSNISIALV